MDQTRLRATPYPDGDGQAIRSPGWREIDDTTDTESVWQATGYKEAWQATLEYWLESGVEFRSGSRLEFYTPPPRSRVGPVVAERGFSPAVPPLTTVRDRPSMAVEAAAVATPSPVQPPPLSTEGRDAPLPAPIPVAERPAVLATLAEAVSTCEQCILAKTRTKGVFGVGAPDASIVFVGEGPGAEEDRQGEPFVGPAGILLDNMLRAIALQRSQVFIANVVKCRPPANRNPHTDEIAACQGYLFRQLEIIHPKIIFCLGKFALLCLTGYTDTVSQARGQSFFWRGIPVIASYHPAYYLRTPSRKRAAWEDLIRLLKRWQTMEGCSPSPDLVIPQKNV